MHHSEDMKTDKEHRVAEEADNMNKADIIEAAGAAGADRTEVVDRIEAGKAGADRVEVAAGKEGIASHFYHNNNLQEPEEAGILRSEGRNASVNRNQEKQTFSPCQIGRVAACSWNPASHRTQYPR